MPLWGAPRALVSQLGAMGHCAMKGCARVVELLQAARWDAAADDARYAGQDDASHDLRQVTFRQECRGMHVAHGLAPQRAHRAVGVAPRAGPVCLARGADSEPCGGSHAGPTHAELG